MIYHLTTEREKETERKRERESSAPIDTNYSEIAPLQLTLQVISCNNTSHLRGIFVS